MKPIQYAGLLLAAFAGGFVANQWSYSRPAFAQEKQAPGDSLKARVMEAEKFLVKDGKGRVFAELNSDGLRIMDGTASKEREAATITLSMFMGPSISLRDNHGDTRYTITLNDRATEVNAKGPEPTHSLGFQQFITSDTSNLFITDLGSKKRQKISFFTSDKYGASMQISDEGGKVLWQAPEKK